jgi:hypothetical protein
MPNEYDVGYADGHAKRISESQLADLKALHSSPAGSNSTVPSSPP